MHVDQIIFSNFQGKYEKIKIKYIHTYIHTYIHRYIYIYLKQS